MMLFFYVYEQNTDLRYTHGIAHRLFLSLRTTRSSVRYNRCKSKSFHVPYIQKMTTTVDHQLRSWTRKAPFYPERKDACYMRITAATSFIVYITFTTGIAFLFQNLDVLAFVPFEDAFGSWIVWSDKNHKKNEMEQQIARLSVHIPAGATLRVPTAHQRMRM
jgi:hypothetical protein